MGDEWRLQSWIFDMFILDRVDQELHSLERLEQDNNCFATQSFMLPKVTATTKDIENKELSIWVPCSLLRGGPGFKP